LVIVNVSYKFGRNEFRANRRKIKIGIKRTHVILCVHVRHWHNGVIISDLKQSCAQWTPSPTVYGIFKYSNAVVWWQQQCGSNSIGYTLYWLLSIFFPLLNEIKTKYFIYWNNCLHILMNGVWFKSLFVFQNVLNCLNYFAFNMIRAFFHLLIIREVKIIFPKQKSYNMTSLRT